ncbi:MAG: hypothetical protein JW751_28180 [Polyangiaceae bacterium]|nr:hypothetical protein [Polyangiaceae bacterium]
MIEIRARGVPFYTLIVELAPPAPSRRVVVSSQLVGPNAFSRLRAVLVLRGVPIT